MSAGTPRLFATAAEMRRAFDQGFAAAPPGDAAGATEDLLAIQVAGEAFVLRLRELAGLYRDRPVIRLPGPVPELIGIAGVRGIMVPVYGLGAILGHPRGEPGRWLVVVRGPDPLGLAVDTCDGLLRAPRPSVPEEGNPTPHLGPAVLAGGRLRRLVDLASVAEAIKTRTGPAGPAKER